LATFGKVVGRARLGRSSPKLRNVIQSTFGGCFVRGCARGHTGIAPRRCSSHSSSRPTPSLLPSGSRALLGARHLPALRLSTVNSLKNPSLLSSHALSGVAGHDAVIGLAMMHVSSCAGADTHLRSERVGLAMNSLTISPAGLRGGASGARGVSMSAAEGKYRPCASALVYNSKRQILIGERSDRAGQWQMPQGGIEEGEAPGDAAVRWGSLPEGSQPASLLRKRNVDGRVVSQLSLFCYAW